MSDGDLAARLRATVDTERIATHSEECWRWHRDCALLMACDELDRLREAIRVHEACKCPDEEDVR